MSATDRIVVQESAMQEAIDSYNKCKSEFENAYLQMSNSVRQIDTVWDGKASEDFKSKFNQMYNNIAQTAPQVQASVDHMNKTLQTFAEAERTTMAMVESMDVGTNPWA